MKSTQELRDTLIATIQEVRAGKTNPKQAMAIGKLCTGILQSVKLDLEYIKFNASVEKLDKAGSKYISLIEAKKD